MITQHLYTTDAVSATFLSAFLAGDAKTAAQTAKELLVSGEQPRLRKLATLAWLCDDPRYNTAERIATYELDTLEPFLKSLLTERRIEPKFEPPRVPTVPYETHSPCPWRQPPSGWTSAQTNTVWRAVKDAIKHRNIDRATFLTAYLVADHKASIANLLTALGVKNTLIQLLEATDSRELAPSVLALAYASLVYVTSETHKVHPAVEHSLDTTPLMGRGGRLFAISSRACAEWGVPIPPESDLMGAPTLIQRGTPFWLSVLETYKIHFSHDIQCANEELLEAFYSTYFPDDIPDEWATPERQKSHGFAASNVNYPLRLCFASSFFNHSS